MTYNGIEWLPLTVGLTVLGLILSYLAYKRRGPRAGMMGAAWSLLPVAAYMTGATEMLWKVGAAIGQFGTGFVFSPLKWAGIGVTGLAVALFLAAGGRVRRKAAREAHRAARGGRKADEAKGSAAPSALAGPRAGTPGTRILPTRREQVPAERPASAAPAKTPRKAAAPDDDDMQDIEDILRKRGI